MATALPRLTITMPPNLKKKLAVTAKRQHLTSSQYIVRAVERQIKNEDVESQKFRQLMIDFRKSKNGTAEYDRLGDAVGRAIVGS